MMTTIESPTTQHMLWRGAMYEALAFAFSYPDTETLAGLGAALETLAEHEETARHGDRLAFDALAAALAAAEPEALAERYNLLFAGEVLCPAGETEYELDAFTKARQLADIAGFYHAFGLHVPEDRPAPADSLATELEFLSQTVMRQAYAALNGWAEQQQLCEEAQRSFLEDHLGRWAPLFCRSLFEMVEGEGFYAAAAALCEQFVIEEIRASGANPTPASPRRINPADAQPFTCMYATPGEEEKEDAP